MVYIWAYNVCVCVCVCVYACERACGQGVNYKMNKLLPGIHSLKCLSNMLSFMTSSVYTMSPYHGTSSSQSYKTIVMYTTQFLLNNPSIHLPRCGDGVPTL